MILIDTGYLLAILRPRDELHQRALAWADVLDEPLLVTEYVLWETANALSVPMDRPKLHSAIDEILNAPEWEVVAASKDWFETGLNLHRERTDKEWSLTDCISFVVIRQRGIARALTFDHHFEQAGFEALLRRDAP